MLGRDHELGYRPAHWVSHVGGYNSSCDRQKQHEHPQLHGSYDDRHGPYCHPPEVLVDHVHLSRNILLTVLALLQAVQLTLLETSLPA